MKLISHKIKGLFVIKPQIFLTKEVVLEEAFAKKF